MLVQKHCWAVTLAVGRARCGWPGSSVLECGFQLDTLCKHIWLNMCTFNSDLRQTFRNNYCLSRETPVPTVHKIINETSIIIPPYSWSFCGIPRDASRQSVTDDTYRQRPNKLSVISYFPHRNVPQKKGDWLLNDAVRSSDHMRWMIGTSVNETERKCT